MTANGLMEAYALRTTNSLRVSSRKYYPDEVLLREVPDAPANGLLPATLFRAIHVSNSGGYLVLDPKVRL